MAKSPRSGGSATRKPTRAAPAEPAAATAASQPAGALGTATAARTGNGGGATNIPGGVIQLVARQRATNARDVLTDGKDDRAGKAFIAMRQAGAANLFKGMEEVHGALGILNSELAPRPAPAQIIATLAQPDGGAGRLLQVEFDPKQLGARQPVVTALSDDGGAFRIALPKGAKLPQQGNVALSIHGGNAIAKIDLPFAQIAANGFAGTLVLPQHLAPLPVSILAALEAVAPAPAAHDQQPALDNQPQLPVVRVGDCDECLLQFGSNQSVDKFPYGIFFRLIEPRASVMTEALTFQFGNKFGYLGSYGTSLVPVDQISFVDRVPVDQPLSIDGLRDRLMGLTAAGTFTGDETVPMAGTLGLGYMLWMSQRWTYKGLALGDLVYSLPLAPGEQQQVAIFERRDSTSVFESEFFSESEAIQQAATADTSTDATFNSAFNEVINGRSSFQTDSSTSSVGGSFLGFISGGSGSSSSSGTSSSSLQGQRDTAQRASEATHSAAQSAASARRSAARTGMRTASSSESESVTTKTVTNHNHTRALTMQYWEVLRLYDVTTAIDGLTLTVLVPLQVVRFLPPGQAFTITNPAQVGTRSQVLIRYNVLARHADVLENALPRKYRYGLSLLQQFVSDPTASVEPSGGVAEDVIQFTLSGGFIPGEDVSVRVVTNRGTRVGPAHLSRPGNVIPPDRFASRDELLDWLRQQRQTGLQQLGGAVALPPGMNRNAVVGFEISRRFQPISYTLISPEQAQINALQAMFPGNSSWITQAIESTLGQTTARQHRQTVLLDAAELERTLGGPRLGQFRAHVVELDANGNAVVGAANENYANDNLAGVELTADPYPVPALQLGPVLRYREILEIEKMAQHVASKTLTYSKAVWASMTQEERAILLEGYTIGVPAGGIADASQMVPLLNCVENRVLGFFGNSMILPFVIPEVLARSGGRDGAAVDPGAIQESLLAYQQAAFKPPHSTIALPTKGVLGEAVLGRCSSAEKIDLTRFWNWQDSPADTAPTIAPVTLPTESPSLTAGVTAPNSLTTLAPLINNVLTAPNPDTTLLQALGANAAAQKDFDSSLTGATQLAGLLTNAQNVSNNARADALATSKELQSQVIATAGNIIGGMYGGNPNAGSSAAAATHGQGAPSGGSGTGTGGSGTGGTGSGSGSGRPPGGGSGSGGTGGTGGSTGSGGAGGSSGGGGAAGGGSGGGTPSPVPTPGAGAGGSGGGGGTPGPTPGPSAGPGG